MAMPSPRSSWSVPTLSCSRKRANFTSWIQSSCVSIKRSASRITSLALFYRPLSTLAFMRDSSSAVRDTCMMTSEGRHLCRSCHPHPSPWQVQKMMEERHTSKAQLARDLEAAAEPPALTKPCPKSTPLKPRQPRNSDSLRPRQPERQSSHAVPRSPLN